MRALRGRAEAGPHGAGFEQGPVHPHVQMPVRGADLDIGAGLKFAATAAHVDRDRSRNSFCVHFYAVPRNDCAR